MKTLVFGLVLIAAAGTAEARGGGSHAIRGYVRSNGTYVAPSGATNPNRTQFDNYSTKGNINPYSGAVGTKTPKY